MGVLRKISQWLNKFAFVFACILTGGMFGITVVNVFLRYFFFINILWAYDALRVLFVGFVFLAASMVSYRREHARFVFFYNKLSKIGKYIVNVLENVTTAVFFGAVVYFGAKLCISVSNQKLPASGISATLLYVLMILAMAIMCVHAIAHIAEDTVAIFGEKKELQGGAE